MHRIENDESSSATAKHITLADEKGVGYNSLSDSALATRTYKPLHGSAARAVSGMYSNSYLVFGDCKNVADEPYHSSAPNYAENIAFVGSDGLLRVD